MKLKLIAIRRLKKKILKIYVFSSFRYILCHLFLCFQWDFWLIFQSISYPSCSDFYKHEAAFRSWLVDCWVVRSPRILPSTSSSASSSLGQKRRNQYFNGIQYSAVQWSFIHNFIITTLLISCRSSCTTMCRSLSTAGSPLIKSQFTLFYNVLLVETEPKQSRHRLGCHVVDNFIGKSEKKKWDHDCFYYSWGWWWHPSPMRMTGSTSVANYTANFVAD